MQEVDADLLQDCERGLMDRLELVAGDEVERREGRVRLAGGLRAAAPPPRSTARRRRRPVSCGGELVVMTFPRF